MTKHVGAFGEVMMRMQVPHYQLLSQSDTLNYSFSGTGVNVLSALSTFGYEGSLVTTLPNNSLGNAALANITKLGISPLFINHDGNYLGMYFLENGFGIRASKVTYSNRLESSFNSGSSSLYDFEKIAKSLDVIHFCGISLAMNDSVRAQIKTLARHVKDDGGTVVFDCNYRPSLWGEVDGYEKAKPHYEEMFKLADIVMMNEKDAIHILGMNSNQVDRKEQLVELIPIVAKTYDINTIAGTHRTINKNNSHSLIGYIFNNGKFHFSEQLSFTVLDRIGAGDAYSSAIIHGLLSDLTSQETVEFASHAAMLAHTYVGDSPLATIDDIKSAQMGSVSDVKR